MGRLSTRYQFFLVHNNHENNAKLASEKPNVQTLPMWVKHFPLLLSIILSYESVKCNKKHHKPGFLDRHEDFAGGQKKKHHFWSFIVFEVKIHHILGFQAQS